MNSLIQLVLVQLKSYYREPAILFWAIIFPIVMAWVLGVAFSSKGETTRLVYVTGTGEIGENLKGEKLLGEDTQNPFRVFFRTSNQSQAIRAIKRGVITLYIEIDHDSLIYHFDPKNPDAQLTYLMLDRELSKVRNQKTVIEPLESKGTRYIDFLIPGLIALGIMNSCIWGIGWNIIETRMKKLLRRMIATPMKKPVFLSALIVTRILVGVVETALLLGFAFLYFETSISGSVLAFVIVFLSGVLAFSGIAILTACRTSKSEVGNGLINAVTLTMTILSGIFFNYQNFPDWAIPVIQALPLTLLADAIRSIFIEGAGVTDIVLPATALLVTGLVTFVIGIRIFRWY